MAKENNYIWAIAFINRKYINTTQDELTMYGYDDIEAYIPTIKVLKKQFKGKKLFEFVPLLFNYGFFKIKYEDACNYEYLSSLRQRITSIYAWVKDPVKLNDIDRNLRADNNNFIDAMPRAAVATDKEIANLVKASKSMSVYSQEDLKQFSKGDYIKLEGYPFDGMPAEIIKINHKKGEVKVKLLIEAMVREVTVSFENVFYTIYKNFSEESKESSTDELKERYGSNAVDFIVWNKKINNEYGQ
jgi:transcription antitermination factor NusG